MVSPPFTFLRGTRLLTVTFFAVRFRVAAVGDFFGMNPPRRRGDVASLMITEPRLDS